MRSPTVFGGSIQTGTLDIGDQRQLELELPVYDALYAWAKQQVA